MKLSIVTINYNNAVGLLKTLESIIKQNANDFEHIIIDGASTDDSVNVIRNYEKKLNEKQNKYLLKWISEPDKGIYNAMNKGIDYASGDYLLFINSGDTLFDDNVVSTFISYADDVDIISGDTLLTDSRKRYAIDSDKLYFDYFVEDSLLHSSTFIKKTLFEQYGKYTESFKIVSDWEFWIKTLICGSATYSKINTTISCFDVNGISNQKEFVEKQNIERQIVLNKFLPRIYPLYYELIALRDIATEYRHLKQGKFGWLINVILKIKKKK